MWIAFTAAVFGVMLFPLMDSSTNRSMSKTEGATGETPVYGVAVMPTLIPPVGL